MKKQTITELITAKMIALTKKYNGNLADIRLTAASYDASDDAQVWFSKVKEVAASLGFAAEMRDYKADPAAYKGSVSDVAEVLRIAVTGRANTPDLWSIMRILGEERTRARIAEARNGR